MDDKLYKIIYQTEKTHWWYRVRRKMVSDLVRKYCKNKQDLKILDVGCGPGELMNTMKKFGNVSGVDTSPLAVDFCKKRGLESVALGDIRALEFEDNVFDVVVCLDVLEHVEDDDSAIKELKRVLKKDGVLIIFVPAFNFLWGVTDDISHHFRRYRLKDLRKKIRGFDLKILKSSYFNTFLFPLIAFFRLFVRLFRIKLESENEIGPKFVNDVFYFVFYLESRLLKFVSFPFGVSAMFVCKK